MPRYRPETAKAKAKSLTKAYVKAGFNQSEVARRQGLHRSTINKKLKKAPVQQAIAETFERAGITDQKIAKRIAEGLNATETKFFQHEGIVQETREVIDYEKRHKYAVTALEVKKHIRAEEGSGEHITIKVEYGHRKPKELEK